MNWYKKANVYEVYHGTGAEFDEFSYKFLGTTGTGHGFGFYFTNDYDFAKMFSRNDILPKKYLIDIKKPLSTNKKTISYNDLSKFLRVLDPTAEIGYLSNWGDINSERYENILRKAVLTEIQYSDNDVDMISSIINADGRDAETAYHILTETLGYDGIIIKRGEPANANEEELHLVTYIVFNNSQIQKVDVVK